MVDTQRFAIWHPPSMPTDVKKQPPVPILPEPPQTLNKNIENLVKDFKWNDGFGPAKSSPVPTSRPRVQSVSSYARPVVAPQQIHLATHMGKTDEDDSESTSSEEDVIKISPVMRKFSSSSPPRPILGSTPLNSNLSNTRPKQAERVSFALPKGTPKENESNLSQTRTRPAEKPTTQGPKATVKQPSPVNVPEQPKLAPGLKKPAGSTETKKDRPPEPKPLMRSPPPIESRRITPPDPKFVTQHKREIPKPVPGSASMLPSSQIGRQPLAPIHDHGFVTHNGFTSIDAFLVQLQDEAFDSTRLTMMEVSIRQFHLIAADADVQLTRKLCSIRTANIGEKRQALIEEHKLFMEAQATSLLTDINALHDRLKEQQTMSARGLLDIPVDEDGWEQSVPPSTGPWKTVSPPVQPKSSDSWKIASSPPKTTEVPKSQAPPKSKQEPELAMPSFWKPSWDSDLTEPSTPQVPPISRLVTVEDIPDEEDVLEPAAPAPSPVPVPRNTKPAQAPAQHPIPMKTQIPAVADEPTPIWGQPWRKGKPTVSNTSSNQATKPVHVSPPLPPVVEKTPTPPLVTVPAPDLAPVPSPTPSPTQTKPKSAKQLRAERARKGKNKAAATVTKEDAVEEQEEVSTPPSQQPQPPAPRKTGIDAAIDNMVNTGNFQSALEQINWAWK